jgi:hypothetical protein
MQPKMIAILVAACMVASAAGAAIAIWATKPTPEQKAAADLAAIFSSFRSKPRTPEEQAAWEQQRGELRQKIQETLDAIHQAVTGDESGR